MSHEQQKQGAAVTDTVAARRARAGTAQAQAPRRAKAAPISPMSQGLQRISINQLGPFGLSVSPRHLLPT
eukprot:scaffold13166_cov114-Isochrysis_galbana.AAC.1